MDILAGVAVVVLYAAGLLALLAAAAAVIGAPIFLVGAWYRHRWGLSSLGTRGSTQPPRDTELRWLVAWGIFLSLPAIPGGAALAAMGAATIADTPDSGAALLGVSALLLVGGVSAWVAAVRIGTGRGVSRRMAAVPFGFAVTVLLGGVTIWTLTALDDLAANRAPLWWVLLLPWFCAAVVAGWMLVDANRRIVQSRRAGVRPRTSQATAPSAGGRGGGRFEPPADLFRAIAQGKNVLD